ncbi:hypothetical protein BDW74DRAFT_181252 [Aspergillus multicolor]|uniref:uncharacterized protein n=1 Tax=Aspergillus multicolor TaxID=41759 RepID=UPI003CCE226E
MSSDTDSDMNSNSVSDYDNSLSDDELDERALPGAHGTTKDSSHPHHKTYAPKPIRALDSASRVYAVPIISSKELDYALLEVSSGDDNIMNLPLLTRDTVTNVRPGATKVSTTTRTGSFLLGKLSERPSYVRPPNADTFEEAFTVAFEGPLRRGDYGSIVRDAKTGMIYGHMST